MFFSIVLIGCGKNSSNEDFDFDEAQKIEVISAENPDKVISIIEDQEEIEDFIYHLQLENWTLGKAPKDAEENHIFEIYRQETKKVFQNPFKERKLEKIGSITTYKDSPYIQLKALFLKLNFKIPDDALEYLSNTFN